MGRNWKCQACGRVHRKSPSRCSECGHTVLQQTDEEVEGFVGRMLNKLGL